MKGEIGTLGRGVSGWRKCKLGDVAKIVTGNTPSTTDLSNYGTDVVWVRPGDLSEGVPIMSSGKMLSNEGGEKARLLPEGSILFCCIGSIGKMGIAGVPLATNQQINAVVFNGAVLPRFGFYYLKTQANRIADQANNAVVPIVSKSRFCEVSFPVPPIEDQRRIAAILDKADAIRRKHQQALALADDFLRSTFLHLFGDPRAKSELQTRAPLKKLAVIRTGKTPPTIEPSNFGGDVWFVTPSDLGGRIREASRSVSYSGAKKSVVVPAESTLVCCIGAIGKMGFAETECAFNQQINAVTWSKEVDPLYGFHCLTFFAPTIAQHGASTTLPILKKSAFSEIEVPVPEMSKQRLFGQIAKNVEATKRRMFAALHEAAIMVASLSQRAFRGEL